MNSIFWSVSEENQEFDVKCIGYEKRRKFQKFQELDVE